MAGRRRPLTVARAALSRFRADGMTDSAAALTYHALLSLFPALLIGASLFGLLDHARTIDDVTRYLAHHGADGATVDAVRSSLRTAQAGHGGAGAGLAVGLATSVYGASNAFGAAGRALNRMAGVEHERGSITRKALDLCCTIVVIVLGVVALLLVFVGGGLARQLFGQLGLGATAAGAWNVARWPGAALVAMAAFAFVYRTAPHRHETSPRLFPTGAVVAVAIWLAASAGFFVYVAELGSYNAVYGAFAGAVILLVWLWLTNVALLFGAEVDAVRAQRMRSAQAPVGSRSVSGSGHEQSVPRPGQPAHSSR